MSTTTRGLREAPTTAAPEDIRVGQTLQALMFREELSPEGYLIRRKITHDELATGITLPRKGAVTRSYISQICSGRKHLNNDMLYAIARYLGVNPIAIKLPDMDRELVAA